MNVSIEKQTQGYVALHHRRKNWYRVLLILAIITVFCTTYALMMPAITLGHEVFCGKEEHQHTDACYEEKKVLICDKDEESAEPVQKSDSTEAKNEEASEVAPAENTGASEESAETTESVEASAGETDGQQTAVSAAPAHTHSDSCYKLQKVLTCDLPEHEHTEICCSNPNADLETKADWKKQFDSMDLGEDTTANLVKVAESQIGYHESTENFDLDDQGKRQGYTRYGAWRDNPYGEWNTAFAQFCVHYAGIRDIPQAEDCRAWIEKLTPEYFREAATWLPDKGNLVFVTDTKDKDEKENSSEKLSEEIKVGIVTEIMAEDQQLKVVFGDVDGNVQAQTMSMSDSKIAGYAEMPKTAAEAEEEESKATGQLAYKGSDYQVEVTYYEDANIPEDAVLDVKEIKKGTDEYEDYLEQTVSAMSLGDDPSFCRFFDVTILSGGKEIEPESKVSVNVSYDEPLEIAKDESCSAIHFAESGTELLEATVSTDEKGDDTVRFVQDSFSVVGTVITKTFTFENNKDYILYYADKDGNGGQALAAKSDNNIDIIAVTKGTDGYARPKDASSSTYQALMNTITWQYKSGYYDAGFYNKTTGTYLCFNNSPTRSNQKYVTTPILSSSNVNTDTIIVGNAVRLEQAYNNVPFYLSYDATASSNKLYGSSLFGDGSYFTAAKVEEVDDTVVGAGDLTIVDSVREDGCIKPKISTKSTLYGKDIICKWYKSTDEGNTWKEVERRKVTGSSYNVAEDGAWLNVALDKGSDARYLYQVVGTKDGGNVTGETTSVVFIVPYYDSIRNGSFEEPEIPANDYDEYFQPLLPNGTAGMVWKTTASDGIIEYMNLNPEYDNYVAVATKWHNISKAAEGNQCVELNATEPGALYQDVLTTPSAKMYWRVAHMGRGPSPTDGYDKTELIDTMYVVIMSTKMAEEKNVTTTAAVKNVIKNISDYPGAKVAEITDDNVQWYYHSGEYEVPASQYLTRYFFVAGDTAYDTINKKNPNDPLRGTVGNHIDDVSFSTELPPPEKGKANLTVTKTIEGLDEDDAKALLNQLSFSITGAVSETVAGGEFVNFRENADGTYSADYNVDGITAYASYSGVYRTGSITVTEDSSTASLAGYKNTVSVTSYIDKNGTKTSENTSTSYTATITAIPEQQTGVVEFTNDYDRSPLKIQLRKENQNHSPLKGATFIIGYLGENGQRTVVDSYNTDYAADGTSGDAYEQYGYSKIFELDEDTNRIYYIEETKAPDGYYQFLDTVYFKLLGGKVIFCNESGTEITAPEGFSVNNHDESKKLITIVNQSGVVLPEAGGIGANLFVITGVLIMMIPLIYIYLNKRGRRKKGTGL